MLLSRFLFAIFAVSTGMFIFVATVLQNLTKIKGSITMLKMKTLTKCYGSFKVKTKGLNKFDYSLKPHLRFDYHHAIWTDKKTLSIS